MSVRNTFKEVDFMVIGQIFVYENYNYIVLSYLKFKSISMLTPELRKSGFSSVVNEFIHNFENVQQ